MPAIKYKKKTYAGATFPVLEMTKAEYDALPDAKKMDGTVYMITDDNGGWEAERSTYDNTTSGLTATNVQAALDELTSKTLKRVIKKIIQSGNISARGSWGAYSLSESIKNESLYSVQIQSANQIFGQIIIPGSWLKNATMQNPIMIYRGSAAKSDSDNVYVAGNSDGYINCYVGSNLNDSVSLAVYEFFI